MADKYDTLKEELNLRYTGKKGAAQPFARKMISSGTVEKILSEKGNLQTIKINHLKK
ncbi:MAG: hypothetical protein SOZ24_07665 [Treponema sp.]|nr:hypothetical protein [Treponema sp.]